LIFPATLIRCDDVSPVFDRSPQIVNLVATTEDRPSCDARVTGCLFEQGPSL